MSPLDSAYRFTRRPSLYPLLFLRESPPQEDDEEEDEEDDERDKPDLEDDQDQGDGYSE